MGHFLLKVGKKREKMSVFKGLNRQIAVGRSAEVDENAKQEKSADVRVNSRCSLRGMRLIASTWKMIMCKNK